MILPEQVKSDCLKQLLRPLVRLFLRHAYSSKEFIALGKEVFLEEATEELKRSNAKINVSRLSYLSGLDRRDVKRMLEEERQPPSSLNLIGRLLTAWAQDKRFTTQSGKPRVLSYKGENSDFETLVAVLGKHAYPGSMLFELERAGLVEKTARGLRLKREEAPAIKNPNEGYEFLSEDIDDLIQSVEENLLTDKFPSNLHMRTTFDNIFLDKLPEVRRWLLNHGRRFHKEARDYLASFDKDLTQLKKSDEARAAGGRVALSAYSISEEG